MSYTAFSHGVTGGNYGCRLRGGGANSSAEVEEPLRTTITTISIPEAIEGLYSIYGSVSVKSAYGDIDVCSE